MVVTTEFGCKDTISKIVEVRDEFLIFIPNAFTPNGDGNNDNFRPKGLGIKTYVLSIFDRWGNLIFQSGDKGWDGTYKGNLCQDDIYVYKIIVIDNNNNLKHEKTGHVSLLK